MHLSRRDLKPAAFFAYQLSLLFWAKPVIQKDMNMAHVAVNFENFTIC